MTDTMAPATPPASQEPVIRITEASSGKWSIVRETAAGLCHEAWLANERALVGGGSKRSWEAGLGEVIGEAIAKRYSRLVVVTDRNGVAKEFDGRGAK